MDQPTPTDVHTLATLVIGDWSTDLYLSATDWQRGQPRDWHNVWFVGADVTASAREAADKLIAEQGYARVGEWAVTADPTVHTATIR